ncbi:MAG: universal stress protein [Desulfobacterales bacterium]|jgi:nucleotide-binding universal stress UspA family protein
MEGFANILFPVALTDISPRVAPYVALMAQKFEARVHLLHVLRRFDWFVDTYVSDPPEPDFKRIASDFESQLMTRTQQKLDQFQGRHLTGVSIAKAAVVSGTHYKEILQYVESNGIDLIIMGTGTTLRKVMFGAVAERVSRLAEVPVMLIKGI